MNLQLTPAKNLSKAEMKSINGGSYLCTCSDPDGGPVKTIVGEADSPMGCVALCKKHWEKVTSFVD